MGREGYGPHRPGSRRPTDLELRTRMEATDRPVLQEAALTSTSRQDVQLRRTLQP